ncbi:response regulator with CheY-like receiver domain and winged-helix DNA-binding domain [Desulfitobacterium dehalogenans ATCC 51507]|uniref:Stage 0 sporulation protein A homolog n=1 Tax=Desulfitobacterium dehalogenans (strain ATCC 51507 / DSM 9161 / JW/IU-DC1) TaxID=756499 RepID=I4AEH3_DESDJ|nr:response regulator with CheY-like receiver domain and winged-helix DNA-binding domain [Desulfitobacterium dehalogenans ATCC 51507]
MIILSKKVLIAEDEPKILRFMRANLEVSNYVVYTAGDGEDALRKYEQFLPDIILLDIMLPKLEGYQVLREIRQFSDVPVILISAKQNVSDKVKGLELGADDYIVKPFDITEMLARVKAVLKRTMTDKPDKNPDMVIGSLMISLGTHTVKVNSVDIKLTPTEYKLLVLLAKDRGCVLTHTDLLTKIWGAQYSEETHYVRVCIARIRQKIDIPEGQPGYIHTVQMVGYMML